MKPTKPKKSPLRVNAPRQASKNVSAVIKTQKTQAPKPAATRPTGKRPVATSTQASTKLAKSKPARSNPSKAKALKARPSAQPAVIVKPVVKRHPKTRTQNTASSRASQGVSSPKPTAVVSAVLRPVPASQPPEPVVLTPVVLKQPPVQPEPAMMTYAKDAVAWFRSQREDPLRHLSNRCGGHPIYWPPERDAQSLWCSSEQLFLSAQFSTKAWRRPRNHPSAEGNVRNRIRMQKTAWEALKTQRCAKALVRPDWAGEAGVQLKAMLWALELKLYFNAHRGFGRALAETGDRPIVEVTAHDDFWGAREVSPGVLVGHNHLGRLLTSVRDRADAILDGHFTYPEGFLLA